jgi:prepilin-type N-terminal cleavage/methylation domain-containing protein/prepilin-type processing-associated H-X9-DG protein
MFDLLNRSSCRSVCLRRPGGELRGRAGFTLVELLVVIGVSTVLLGMLMPALQQAHDRAVKVSCANNLRQLYSSIQAYSYASHDYIPLGFDYYAGSNYVAYNGRMPGGAKQILGVLDNLNLLDVPTIAYCPAEQDPAFQYNTSVNPWMTWNYVNPDCYLGYGTRPDVDWQDCVSDPSGMPKLTQLGAHTAILADTFPAWSALATRHGDGVNVCYSDGSVHYVLAHHTLEPLKQIPAFDYANYDATTTPVYYNYVFLNLTVTPNTGIWAAFDQQ